MTETNIATFTSLAYNLLSGLVLDDTGKRWGEIATDWQREEALAVVADLVPTCPRRFTLLPSSF